MSRFKMNLRQHDALGEMSNAIKAFNDANKKNSNSTNNSNSSNQSNTNSGSSSNKNSSSTSNNSSGIYQVQSNGKAPSGLKSGDQVVTGGGTYQITGVNTDGSYTSKLVNANQTSQNYAGSYSSAGSSASSSASTPYYIGTQTGYNNYQNVLSNGGTVKMGDTDTYIYKGSDGKIYAQQGNETLPVSISNDFTPQSYTINSLLGDQRYQALMNTGQSQQMSDGSTLLKGTDGQVYAMQNGNYMPVSNLWAGNTSYANNQNSQVDADADAYWKQDEKEKNERLMALLESYYPNNSNNDNGLANFEGIYGDALKWATDLFNNSAYYKADLPYETLDDVAASVRTYLTPQQEQNLAELERQKKNAIRQMQEDLARRGMYDSDLNEENAAQILSNYLSATEQSTADFDQLILNTALPLYQQRQDYGYNYEMGRNNLLSQLAMQAATGMINQTQMTNDEAYRQAYLAYLAATYGLDTFGSGNYY